MPDYVEREFRGYLECGILAHGFTRALCAGDSCALANVRFVKNRRTATVAG